MSLLAVSGDVGGAQAVIPVLKAVSESNEPVAIVDHGFLAGKAHRSWGKIPAVLKGDNSLESLFNRGCFSVLIFTTSVSDTLPLKVARIARRSKIFVICLLDNWMNYGLRLETDGEGRFLPDIYLVMDQLAFDEARVDGIPESILRINGHPALASLGEEYHRWRQENRKDEFKKYGLKEDKKLIVFVSESAEADQGSGPESPQYRGYTEKTVLMELCARLQPFSDKIQLGIIPHPREEIDGLSRCWKQCRGALDGGLLRMGAVRQAIFLADGVAGMASILLHEAWLINKPVISLQPGLCRIQLDFMRKREGAVCVTDVSEWSAAMRTWLDAVGKKGGLGGVREELKMHVQAPRNAAGIIMEHLNKKRRDPLCV